MAYERRDFAGGAAPTTLASGIGSGDSSLSIASSSGWPSGTLGDFFIVVDRGNAGEEKIRCSTRTGTTLNVATSGRGADSTSAAAHASGVTVEHCFTAYDANEANAAVAATLGSVTAAGDILYTPGASQLQRLAMGTSGQYLRSGAIAPLWASLGSTDISDLTETIQDTVGAQITAGTNITVAYDDSTGLITIAVSGLTSASLSDFTEATQDVLGALGWGGSGLTFTYDDTANTAVIAVNVDNVGLEVVADTLALRDGGVTQAKFASGILPTVVATSAPTGVAGQQWYDSDDNLLYVYNGTSWVCITPQSARVATSQSVANLSYTDLGTVGPAVTVTTGTKALVFLGCNLTNATISSGAAMSFAVSGASTVAASDSYSVYVNAVTSGQNFSSGSPPLYVTGLTAGANTFTAKYRSVTSGTTTFGDRSISVVGIP